MAPAVFRIRRSLVVACGGLLAFDIFWFFLLFPLVPRTSNGWLAWQGAGLAIGAALGAGSVYSEWLERRKAEGKSHLLWKAVGILAVGVFGATILGCALFYSDFVSANLSYRSH
jgi:hypothetical protein